MSTVILYWDKAVLSFHDLLVPLGDDSNKSCGKVAWMPLQGRDGDRRARALPCRRAHRWRDVRHVAETVWGRDVLTLARMSAMGLKVAEIAHSAPSPSILPHLVFLTVPMFASVTGYVAGWPWEARKVLLVPVYATPNAPDAFHLAEVPYEEEDPSMLEWG